LTFAACGGGEGGTPTSPSPTSSRVITVSGSLAFGTVDVGGQRDLTITISNSGTATLTVTGLTVSGGAASQMTASWTSGTIPAGASQPVTIRFQPTSAGNYSGAITVNADHTSGNNSIPFSATAASSFGGLWQGSYVIERCDGTGSLQDLLCSANRGVFPVGTALPLRLNLAQSGASVSGTATFGQVTGTVSGIVTGDGVLTLQGTATGGTISLQLTSWSTRVVGNSMTGTITYNAAMTGVPGVGVVSSRLQNVTR
jgi:hypothetical protein